MTVVLLPWMIPARVATQLRDLPIPPAIALWTVAAITVVLAWWVRRQPNQGSIVLAGSLLLVAWFMLVLR